MVRRWGALYLFTSKSASRHNGVQLFISHLPRCLRTRRFSEPTFQPSGATKPRKKHSVSRLSYLFAHLHLLSSGLFSSDSSPCWLLFHLSILSEVWLLNFLRLSPFITRIDLYQIWESNYRITIISTMVNHVAIAIFDVIFSDIGLHSSPLCCGDHTKSWRSAFERIPSNSHSLHLWHLYRRWRSATGIRWSIPRAVRLFSIS